MSRIPSMTSERADDEDNDPWTSIGSYFDSDIAAVRALLIQASITFHFTSDTFPDGLPSLTPHHLWVRDEHVARAEVILVSYFRSLNDERNG